MVDQQLVAGEIEIQAAGPGAPIHLGNGLAFGEHAGITDHNVEPAKVVDRLLDRGFELTAVGNITDLAEDAG